jgi:hypothetical protein
MVEPGFEIYAASFASIAAACSDEAKLRALRNGDVTRFFAHFQPAVPAGDVLLLSSAFEHELGRAINFDIERIETDLGLFVDRLRADWVEAVASLPEQSAASVQKHWSSVYLAREEREPAWATLDQVDAIRNLIVLCQVAVRVSTDVVMVWSL